MFDAEIATPGDLKTVEEIAKLAGKCLRLEFDKRPDMLEVAERLRWLRNAAHERTAPFSWGRRYKPARAQTTPSQESNIRSQSVRIAAPAEVAPSQERSRTIHYVGTFRFRSTASDNLSELEDLLRTPASVLGCGTVGSTYMATLRESGVEVVIKRVKVVNLSKAEFEKRVTTIGAVQSEHIVPLRAYYYIKNEVLLLYDNFPMPSLEKALHGIRLSGLDPLDWEQRLAISLGAARGVASIHLVGPSSCHGNIRSSNILLTSNHDARVSEHGLITLGKFSNASAYRAPEVTNHRQWAHSAIFGEVLDGELLPFLLLAVHCCSEDAKLRPRMSDVVQRIEEMHANLRPSTMSHA
ncbi:hypothetical protein ACQ4PT_007339 [Festuca glaucescens]